MGPRFRPTFKDLLGFILKDLISDSTALYMYMIVWSILCKCIHVWVLIQVVWLQVLALYSGLRLSLISGL